MSKYVRRVDQLDASYLNEELFSLLSSQFRKSLLHFPNIFLARVGPEFEVIFKFFYTYLALKKLNCSFGQRFFDLQYSNSGTLEPASSLKLKILSLTTVIFPWFWERIVRNLISKHTYSALHSFDKLEFYFKTLYQFLSLINFFIFLQKSTYLSVEERLLSIRPLHEVPQDIRPAMYDNVTRELLWHGLAEVLGLILNTVNVYYMKNLVKKQFPWIFKNPENRIDVTKCHICSENPTYPHSFGCRHVFCYYCLASNVKADNRYFCSDCEMEARGLSSIKPCSINYYVSQHNVSKS